MCLTHYLYWYIEATSVHYMVQLSIISRAIRERKTQRPYKMGYVGVSLGCCTLHEISPLPCLPSTLIFFLLALAFVSAMSRYLSIYLTASVSFWFSLWSYFQRYTSQFKPWTMSKSRKCCESPNFEIYRVCYIFFVEKDHSYAIRHDKSLADVQWRKKKRDKRTNECPKVAACGEGIDLPKEAA